MLLLLSTGNQQVDAIHVTQLERDTVLVCLDRTCSLFLTVSTCKICTNGFHIVLIYVSELVHSNIPSFFYLAENLKIVNLQGRLKSNKKLASELSFDFCIGSVGRLSEKYLLTLTRV